MDVEFERKGFMEGGEVGEGDGGAVEGGEDGGLAWRGDGGGVDCHCGCGDDVDCDFCSIWVLIG